MKTLRTRLLLSHVVPLLVLIPLLIIVIASVLQSQDLLIELSDQLTEQAELLAILVEERPEVWGSSIEAQSFVDDFSRSMQIHITLIQPGGNLLASSDPNTNNGTSQFTQVQEMIRVEEDENTTRVEHIIVRENVSDNSVTLPVLDADQELVGVLQVRDQLSDVYDLFGNLQPLMLALVIGGLIMATIIGLVLALRLEHNLQVVTTAIVQVANGENLTPVTETGPEEIREVIQAFNTLVTRLDESQDSRKHLLSNLVHELGQPLGAMGSAVRALSSGAYQDDELREQLLNGLDTHIQSMQPLLDNLVQLHQQIIGLPELQRQSVSISKWLPPIVQTWQSSAAEKELVWQVNIQPDIPEIDIDPQQMAQVINNLISNAIKYTPIKGNILIQANARHNDIVIAVEDSGTGIPVDEQQQIFEPFYRSNSHKRFSQGMGLGLSIAHDIVKSHDGHLNLSDVDPSGSRFEVVLPISRA